MTCCMFPGTATNGKLTGWTFKDGFPVVYVCNATAPDLSEFGHIGIKAVGGGIIRTM